MYWEINILYSYWKDGYGENIYDELNEGLYIVVWDYRVYIITSEIRFMLWYGMKIYGIYIFYRKQNSYAIGVNRMHIFK